MSKNESKATNQQNNEKNPLGVQATIKRETPASLSRSVSNALLSSAGAQSSTAGLVRRQSARQLLLSNQQKAYSNHKGLSLLQEICSDKQLKNATIDLSGAEPDPNCWKVKEEIQFCTPIICADPDDDASSDLFSRVNLMKKELTTVFKLLGISHLQQGKNMIYVVSSFRFKNEERLCVERSLLDNLFKQDPQELRDKVEKLESSMQTNNNNADSTLKAVAISIGKQVIDIIDTNKNLQEQSCGAKTLKN